MEQNPVRTDAIFQWNMTNAESETFSLACIYETQFLRLFKGFKNFGGEFRRNTLPKRSDPRKSLLFKHCWKLRRETRGLLEPHQYKRYIVANLSILKLNYLKHDGSVRVEPNSICGDGAWMRWMMFERWCKNKDTDVSSEPPAPSVANTDIKVIIEIDRTKKFLYERCEGDPTQEKISNFFESGIFKFWTMTEKVSKFYIVLSPFVDQACNIEEFSDSCSFDPILFRQKITDEVKDYFKYEYTHEYI
jgi:hypothetical protein